MTALAVAAGAYDLRSLEPLEINRYRRPPEGDGTDVHENVGGGGGA